MLEELNEWSLETKMVLSQAKTVVMTLQERIQIRGRKERRRKICKQKILCQMCGMRVKTVRRVRYLSVQIEERLKFEEHSRNVATSVVREFAKLERASRANKG